jgi:predicted nucleic acid-binding protein
MFTQVIIPPTVFRELRQPNTPQAVCEWALSLPPWASVQAPETIDLSLSIDAGELEAICLALEINATALLIDDLAGRTAAIQCGLVVVGTVGLIERAAALGLLNLTKTIDQLRQTNARIHPDLIREALRRDAARKERPPTA